MNFPEYHNKVLEILEQKGAPEILEMTNVLVRTTPEEDARMLVQASHGFYKAGASAVEAAECMMKAMTEAFDLSFIERNN